MFITYNGKSDVRTITAADFAAAGLTSVTRTWNKANGFSIDLPPDIAAFCLAQGEFYAESGAVFGDVISGGGATKVPLVQTQTVGTPVAVFKVQPSNAARGPFGMTVFDDGAGNHVMYFGYNAAPSGGKYLVTEHALKWVHESNYGTWCETYIEYLDPSGTVGFRPYFLVLDKTDTNPDTLVKTHEFVGAPFTWKTAPGPSGTPVSRGVMDLTGTGVLRTFGAPGTDPTWQIHADTGRSSGLAMYAGGVQNLMVTSVDANQVNFFMNSKNVLYLNSNANVSGIGLGGIPASIGGILSIVMDEMIGVADAGKYFAGIMTVGHTTPRQYNDHYRWVKGDGSYQGRINKDGYFITAKTTAIVDADINNSEGSLWWDNTPSTGGLRVKGKDSAGGVITQVLGAVSMPLTGTQTTTTRKNVFSLQASTSGVGAFSAGMVGTLFNSTMDYVMDIGYNPRRVVSTEPSFTFTIESDYEPAPGTHALEAYFEYFSPNGSVSYRPIFFYINRATNSLSATYKGDTLQFQTISGDNYLITQPGQLVISQVTGVDANLRIGAAASRSSAFQMQNGGVDVLSIQANASYFIQFDVGTGATFKNFCWMQTNGAVGVGTYFGVGSADSTAVIAADCVASNVNAKGILARGKSGQVGSLFEVQDNTSAVLSRFDKNGYFMTRKTTAPADADLANGELSLWLDSTNGAAKLMVKAKQADGTVRTAAVALA